MVKFVVVIIKAYERNNNLLPDSNEFACLMQKFSNIDLTNGASG